MKSSTPPDEDRDIRERIIAMVEERGIPADRASVILSQCKAFVTDQLLVAQTAQEAGYRLTDFKTDDQFELSFNIKSGKYDVGFISKGWDAPGFRIGETLLVRSDQLSLFRAKADELMNLCARNGVALSGTRCAEGLELAFDAVIFQEGLNSKTFGDTAEAVSECVDLAAGILGL